MNTNTIITVPAAGYQGELEIKLAQMAWNAGVEKVGYALYVDTSELKWVTEMLCDLVEEKILVSYTLISGKIAPAIGGEV